MLKVISDCLLSFVIDNVSIIEFQTHIAEKSDMNSLRWYK